MRVWVRDKMWISEGGPGEGGPALGGGVCVSRVETTL